MVLWRALDPFESIRSWWTTTITIVSGPVRVDARLRSRSDDCIIRSRIAVSTFYPSTRVPARLDFFDRQPRNATAVSDKQLLLFLRRDRRVLDGRFPSTTQQFYFGSYVFDRRFGNELNDAVLGDDCRYAFRPSEHSKPRLQLKTMFRAAVLNLFGNAARIFRQKH